MGAGLTPYHNPVQPPVQGEPKVQGTKQRFRGQPPHFRGGEEQRRNAPYRLGKAFGMAS